MLASMQPSSAPSLNSHASAAGSGRTPKRVSGHAEGASGAKEAIWVPMLQSASKGKDTAEKQLILLGGTPDLQREFLDQLNPKELRGRGDNRKRNNVPMPKNIPISNKYALGYTYHDVLDADQEDVLARLNIHLLTNPSGSFASLLKPLLTPKTVKDTLAIILLDWSDPFRWARQLRQWVRLLRRVIVSLDEETKIELEQNMNAWKEKRIGSEAATSNAAPEQTAALLGPGEWEEGLGIALSVVCVQREKIERLEKELGWQDDQFDFLQQWLRTVLLKHGASLIYTATFDVSDVRPLIHASLSIQSLLKTEIVKHNVIDRDKILVPPNWDSWGKIRILREGFDPETIGAAWSIEIQEKPDDEPDFTPQKVSENDPQAILNASQQPTSAVAIFEASLIDPTPKPSSQPNKDSSKEITTTTTPLQEFLQGQSVIMEKLLEEDRQAAKTAKRTTYLDPSSPSLDTTFRDDDATIGRRTASPVKGSLSARLAENIGPYQININGIDFDAEEATRRLRDRETERNAAKSARETATGTSTPGRTKPETPGADGKEKPSNEALHGFFANLIKKGQGGAAARGSSASGPVSPRITSPAPEKMDRKT